MDLAAARRLRQERSLEARPDRVLVRAVYPPLEDHRDRGVVFGPGLGRRRHPMKNLGA